MCLHRSLKVELCSSFPKYSCEICHLVMYPRSCYDTLFYVARSSMDINPRFNIIYVYIYIYTHSVGMSTLCRNIHTYIWIYICIYIYKCVCIIIWFQLYPVSLPLTPWLASLIVTRRRIFQEFLRYYFNDYV